MTFSLKNLRSKDVLKSFKMNTIRLRKRIKARVLLKARQWTSLSLKQKKKKKKK